LSLLLQILSLWQDLSCTGDLNHARYVLFIAFESALSGAASVLLLREAAKCAAAQPDRLTCALSGAATVHLVAGTAIGSASALLLYLLALHSYLMITGQTTYELVKGPHVPYLAAYFRPGQSGVRLPWSLLRLLFGKGAPPPAPFSQGPWENLRVFWLARKPHCYSLQEPPPLAGRSGGGEDHRAGRVAGFAQARDLQFTQGRV